MPLPRFQKLDDSRKKTILAAAAEEFGERGFERASYNRIIDRAGISKGAMYYYFADKDDLYCTVLDTALSQWMTQVGFPFQADDGPSFWAGCEAMYTRGLRFMLDDPRNAALCLSVVHARAGHDGHPALLRLNEQMVQWVTALVVQGQTLGAVRTDLPSELIVHAALALMDAGDRWLASNWDEMTDAAVDGTATTMVDLFRRVGRPET